jgi:putative membrane protein
VRLVLAVALQLVANAVALVVANVVLDDMHLSASGFFVAVGIFTLISAIVAPMIRQAALRRSPAILGSTALIVSLVALVATSILVGDDLRIEGLTTWVLAAVVVWAGGLVAAFLLPFVVFKQLREERSGR